MTNASDDSVMRGGGNGGVIGRLIRWLTAQNVHTVILVMVLVAVGWFIYWVVRDAGPKLMDLIQDGYERQSQSFKEIQREDREAYKEYRKEDREDRKIETKAITEAIRDAAKRP